MARKSRYEINAQNNDKREWRAGVYIRLSREDKFIKESASLSVTNQKEIANRFLANNRDIELVDFFIDDGFTGTDLDRPAFKRLQACFESRLINCVIIKDLSRLARNNQESSKLIHVIFPFFGVRFISITDKVDSFLNPQSVQGLDVGFKNIMNDEYARDSSQKVRSALRVKKGNGLFLGAFAPYGYKKSENDKNKLAVDTAVSWVIKFIFKEFANGKNFNQIAKSLTRKGVLPPRAYKESRGLKYYTPKGVIRQEWSGTTVKTILSSNTYVGNLTQCKSSVISYKNHKMVTNDKRFWITVENTHEPIIDKETFQKTQEKLNESTKLRKSPQKSLFSGLAYCGYCGRALAVAKSVKNKKYLSYYCKGKYNGAKCGFEKRVNAAIIERTVLGLLNAYLRVYLDVERSIKRAKIINGNKLNYNDEIKKLLGERMNLSEEKSSLYFLLKQEAITQSQYCEQREALDKRISALDGKIKEREKRKTANGFSLNENVFWQRFAKIKRFEKVTSELLETFIERIDVFSRTHLEIKLKFASEINDGLDFFKKNENR